METLLSSIFAVISIAAALLIVVGLYRDARREKLVAGILAYKTEVRDKFLSSEIFLSQLLKVAFWLLLFVLIIAIPSFYFFIRPVFVSGTIGLFLMTILCFHEYRFRRWLVKELESRISQRTG